MTPPRITRGGVLFLHPRDRYSTLVSRAQRSTKRYISAFTLAFDALWQSDPAIQPFAK
jgi:hypothetical protein